jgi:hypothetical protein
VALKWLGRISLPQGSSSAITAFWPSTDLPGIASDCRIGVAAVSGFARLLQTFRPALQECR